MIVRQATLLDLLSLAPLADLYAQEAKGHDEFTVDLEHCLSNAAMTIMSDDGCFLVAYEGNQPVGFLWGYAMSMPWSKKKVAFDNLLYTIPAKRNGKAGVMLMKEWESWAKERGAVAVQISIASGIHEEKTISFYKKMGYSYIGTQLRKEC